jgi:hypothetical protein
MHVGPLKVHVFYICFSFDAHLLKFEHLSLIFLVWIEVIDFGNLLYTVLQVK